jgi:hypothetical protein
MLGKTVHDDSLDVSEKEGGVCETKKNVFVSEKPDLIGFFPRG